MSVCSIVILKLNSFSIMLSVSQVFAFILGIIFQYIVKSALFFYFLN